MFGGENDFYRRMMHKPDFCHSERSEESLFDFSGARGILHFSQNDNDALCGIPEMDP
jgi:hypothetical protein